MHWYHLINLQPIMLFMMFKEIDYIYQEQDNNFTYQNGHIPIIN